MQTTIKFHSRASATTGTRLLAAAMLIAVGIVTGLLHGAVPT